MTETYSSHGKGCCSCCSGDLRNEFSRRRFIRMAGAGLVLALPPSIALTAEGDYEAMVLACIDPRMQEPVWKYLAGRQLTGKYSQFLIAGAAIGVVAPAFQEWHKAFWDNLATSIQLHRIRKVIAIDHRDCGAAKIAYGEAKVATPQAETETHRAALAQFRKEVTQRHPQLGVETGLMSLDGSMEMFS
jgi:carbonic anhydrase